MMDELLPLNRLVLVHQVEEQNIFRRVFTKLLLQTEHRQRPNIPLFNLSPPVLDEVLCQQTDLVAFYSQ